MANGHGSNVRVSGSDERFAALDERVTNLRTSFQHLERSTAEGFGRIDAKLGEMAASFAAGQKTPWATVIPSMAFVFSVLITIGWLVYTPVQSTQSRLETSLLKLADVVAGAIESGPEKYVPRREIDTSRARAAEDRANVEKDINDLRTEKLPRNEWLLRNAAVDNEFIDLRRTVEQIRQDFGGTYSLRDAIADLKQRLERVEMQREHELGTMPK